MRGLKLDVCTGYTCAVLGGNALRPILEEFPDLEIKEWECLGNCQNGPNIAIEGELHAQLTPVKLRGILSRRP